MDIQRSRAHLWLSDHYALCVLLMTFSFVAFGLLTMDLIRIIQANSLWIWEFGWRGALEGGLWQFAELWFSAVCAIGCYLCFKFCENVLVHRMSTRRSH